LPACEAESFLSEERVEAPYSPSLSILVIDDEAVVRNTLADMLTALNHRVVLADSGRTALQKLAATNSFDLVFTDLAMPEMDGWETAREIRKYAPELAIVMVTGYGTGTLPPNGEKDLIDAILGKPFDFTQVSDIITQVCTHAPFAEREPIGV